MHSLLPYETPRERCRLNRLLLEASTTNALNMKFERSVRIMLRGGEPDLATWGGRTKSNPGPGDVSRPCQSYFDRKSGCGSDLSHIGHSPDVTPPANLVLATGYAGNGFRVSQVFLNKDAGGQGMRVVGFKHRNRALKDDRAVVQMFIDKVDSAAGHFDAVIECLLLRIEAGKSRQQ